MATRGSKACWRRKWADAAKLFPNDAAWRLNDGIDR